MIANVLRYNVIEKLNLGEFQLSQSYLFFYDKLEKANYYLEWVFTLVSAAGMTLTRRNVLDTLDEDLDSRLITYLNDAPVNDGGQWDMAVNLLGACERTSGPADADWQKSTVLSRRCFTPSLTRPPTRAASARCSRPSSASTVSASAPTRERLVGSRRSSWARYTTPCPSPWARRPSPTRRSPGSTTTRTTSSTHGLGRPRSSMPSLASARTWTRRIASVSSTTRGTSTRSCTLSTASETSGAVGRSSVSRFGA